MKEDLTMTDLVALCKNRGFVFASSEIYGGLSNSWDYGPLGVELKNNLKAAWWKRFVQEEPHNVGLDSAIIMNPKVWKASGHLDGFSDPLIDCKNCKTRHRADKLIEEWLYNKELKGERVEVGSVEAMSDDELQAFIADNKIVCPNCGKCDFTPIRKFNLMFKTFIGVTEDNVNTVYLRPETAGGIFVNFKNVQRATRSKMPMGVCQIGKAFRNEITPGNFIFRMREFEQMEMEFFCHPSTAQSWHEYYRKECYNFLLSLGINADMLRLRDHSPEELCFYSAATTDIEFKFPFGWGELWGIANRTNYDLTQHQTVSGEDMSYTDPFTNENYIPYVVEPSVGVDRMFLAVLCSAYREEKLADDDTRVVLGFDPKIAPIKVAVLPLSKKLEESAYDLYKRLNSKFRCEFDVTGSIGKRYRRQDEIGTPYCVTVDFDTANDNCVTVRNRDTMEQERININDLDSYLFDKIYK